MVRARLQQKDLLAALVEAGKPGVGTHADDLDLHPGAELVSSANRHRSARRAAVADRSGVDAADVVAAHIGAQENLSSRSDRADEAVEAAQGPRIRPGRTVAGAGTGRSNVPHHSKRP